MLFQIGDQFDHYQIGAPIAQGGMSSIYRATDLLNGQEVVLKIPREEMLNDPVALERFQREIEATNTLHHPAIQHGIATGRYDGTPYLATELIEGQSLRALMDSKNRFPIEDAITLIRKIAEGMAYCHEHGVIHRDLKPENILVTAQGQPVIIDFGLALTKNARRVTYANTNPGTPDYMAPEQIEGGRGDERTDIYAIGTIFYEMLTGKTPFSGDTMMAVMAQHLNGVLPRADLQRPGVTPAIAAIIARCLQRQPEDRYPNLRAFIEDLDNPEKADTTILNTAKPWWRRLIPVLLG